MRVDHDHIFKELIQEFFEDFMRLFCPSQADEIDFSSVSFQNQEQFTDIVGGDRRTLDLVARADRRDAGTETILVHTEFESHRRSLDFPRRMYLYYCQLFLRYQTDIVPIAVFSDDTVWRKPIADRYQITVGDQRYVDFRYHLIKLNRYDYRELLKSGRVLAFALAAKAHYDRDSRVRVKLEALRAILQAELSPARETLLIEFLETYMVLNSQEDHTFREAVETEAEYSEVKRLIPTYEKFRQEGREEGLEKGLEKGLQKGRLEGREEGRQEQLRQSILAILERRFGEVDATIVARLGEIHEPSQLDNLLLSSIDVKSVEELPL